MRVLIVEDEQKIAQRLQKLILEVDSSIEVVAILAGVESAVGWLKEHASPDIIFLDIQLADGMSFSIFDKVEVSAPVIFTTAYDEYALKAFSLNSIDYLLKPVERYDIEQSLLKLKRMRQALSSGGNSSADFSTVQDVLRRLAGSVEGRLYRERILLQGSDRMKPVPIGECCYFFSENKATFVQLRSGERSIVDFPLDTLEQELDPKYYFRVSRQWLVHISSIVEVRKMLGGKLSLSLAPHSTKDVTVSRENAAAFREWLSR